MLLSGSVGFHHLATGGVVNDVQTEEVGPLRPEYATELASSLLLGETVRTADPAGVAAAIAEHSEGIPFYIHHLVKSCLRRIAQGP